MNYDNFKTARLVKIDSEGSKKLIKEAKEIYELCVKRSDLVTLPYVYKYQKMTSMGEPLTFLFLKLQKLISNLKGTVKFCIFSGGYFLIIGQNTGVKGGKFVTSIYHELSDIFKVRQGMWVALSNEEDLSIIFAVDGHKGNCEEIADILRLREDLSRKGMGRLKLKNFQVKGLIEQVDFKKQWESILQQARIQFWKLSGLKWLKEQSILKNLVYKKTPNLLKVIAKSFNGHTYSLTVKGNLKQPEYNHYVYYWEDPEPIMFWSPFVHLEPQEVSGYKINPANLNSRLEQRFMNLFDLIDGTPDVTYCRDKVKAHVTMTTGSNGARRYKYNGVDIKRDDVRYRFEQEIQGIKWQSKGKKKGTGKRTVSQEAQGLLEKGLNGDIVDLEGSFPFHLNVDHRDSKWYVSIAGKTFHVKGGISALKRVTSAITGNARINNQYKSGNWQNSTDTAVVLKRFSELIDRKDALWIIKQVKIMGAMYKVMKGTK